MKRFSTISYLVVLLACALSAFSAHALFETNAHSQSEFVNRAILTAAITDREPVDNLNDQSVSPELTKIYFFTEIINKAGESVTHRWFHNGRLVAEVKLNIGANRWRTYSSKNLVKGHKGTWQVEVVDQKNRLLATQAFVVL